jgi:hypothetical protein
MDLFEWELLILGELLQTLESLTLSEGANFWVWGSDSSSIYSVRSAYTFLQMRASVVDGRLEDIVQLIAKVWESWSPLMINVFSW